MRVRAPGVTNLRDGFISRQLCAAFVVRVDRKRDFGGVFRPSRDCTERIAWLQARKICTDANVLAVGLHCLQCADPQRLMHNPFT
jgi:hypothetical protein